MRSALGILLLLLVITTPDAPRTAEEAAPMAQQEVPPAEADDEELEEFVPSEEISADNLEKWLKFVRPSEEELAWQKIRWHRELEDAAAEARKLQRPILLWTMNGHPCGET